MRLVRPSRRVSGPHFQRDGMGLTLTFLTVFAFRCRRRGAIVGNEYSGWLVMTLEDLKEGIIVIKLHTWQIVSESTRTQGCNTVNNEHNRRRLRDTRRGFHEDVVKGKDPSRQYVEVDKTC
jgi:hypothetical protein